MQKFTQKVFVPYGVSTFLNYMAMYTMKCAKQSFRPLWGIYVSK